MKKSTQIISAVLFLTMFMCAASMARAESGSFSIMSEFYDTELITLEAGDTISITVTTADDMVGVRLMTADQYFAWDFQNPTSGAALVSSSGYIDGTYTCTYTATEDLNVELVCYNDDPDYSAFVSYSYTVTAATSPSSFDPTLIIVAVVVVAIIAVVVVKKKGGSGSSGEKGEKKKKEELPWPKNGPLHLGKRVKYVQELSTHLQHELYFKGETTTVKSGQKLSLLYKLTNNFNLPLDVRYAPIIFQYHYQPSEKEMERLIDEAITTIRNDGGSVDHFKEENIKNVRSGADDPRKYSKAWTEIELYGSRAYVKTINTIDLTEFKGKVIQPGESLSFDLTGQVPSIPSMGGQGKDFFVYMTAGMYLLPVGCDYKYEWASGIEGVILPVQGSDRESNIQTIS